jgi:hypothetical protein
MSTLQRYPALRTSRNKPELVLGFGGIFQFHHAVFYVPGIRAALVITRGLIAGTAVVGPLFFGSDFPQWGSSVSAGKAHIGMLQISLGSLIGQSCTVVNPSPAVMTVSGISVPDIHLFRKKCY